jgi:hypothetical protein
MDPVQDVKHVNFSAAVVQGWVFIIIFFATCRKNWRLTLQG